MRAEGRWAGERRGCPPGPLACMRGPGRKAVVIKKLVLDLDAGQLSVSIRIPEIGRVWRSVWVVVCLFVCIEKWESCRAWKTNIDSLGGARNWPWKGRGQGLPEPVGCCLCPLDDACIQLVMTVPSG